MVPGNAVKSDMSVPYVSDAIHLFESLRFWMVDEIPASFVKCALNLENSPFPPSFWNEFGTQFKWLQTLRKCIKGTIKYNSTKMYHIILSGNKELLVIAYGILKYLPPNACELAIHSGNDECLRFVYSHCRDPYLGQHPCQEAIVRGTDEKLLAAVHELGGQWSENACVLAVQQGNLPCLNICMNMAALGANRFATRLCGAAVWHACSTLMSTAVRGMKIFAAWQLALANFISYSTRTNRAVPGTKEYAMQLCGVATSTVCCMLMSKAVPGTKAFVKRRQKQVFWSFYSMHTNRAAPGMRAPALAQQKPIVWRV